MSKIKINNEYAVRINHPELGVFYFSYCGLNEKFNPFVFTKILSKVQTWKTIKFAEKQINIIISQLESNEGKIYLSLGTNIECEYTSKIFQSRKKYYYLIDSIQNVRSKINLITANKNVNNLNVTLIEDSEEICNVYKNIKNNFFINKIKKLDNCDVDFDEILKYSNDTLLSINTYNAIQNELVLKVNNYLEDISLYKKDISILEDSKTYKGLYLDIIDASYGFRRLKLNTLNLLQDN